MSALRGLSRVGGHWETEPTRCPHAMPPTRFLQPLLPQCLVSTLFEGSLLNIVLCAGDLMEGIPFIIVEPVPKGESGAERNTGLLGSPFPAAPVAPGRLRGCRVSPTSGLPFCLSSLDLPGAGSPMRPQLPLGAGAAGTAVGRTVALSRPAGGMCVS